MKRGLRQLAGAILIGMAGGLIAHYIAQPEDEEHRILGFASIGILTAVGGYLLSGMGTYKKVTFEFVGGFMNGKVLVGELTGSANAKSGNEVSRHYYSTDRGTIGKRFWSASDYMVDTLKHHGGDVAALRAASLDPRFQCDHYEVIERRENGDGVLVRAKYVRSSTGQGNLRIAFPPTVRKRYLPLNRP